MRTVIGPLSQILTFNQLPAAGPIPDDRLEIIKDAWIVCHNGIIEEINTGNLREVKHSKVYEIEGPRVAIPGFVDAHTHLCFSGSRERDYALRISGVSYQEIAERGGGILDTVAKTRAAGEESLLAGLLNRLNEQLKQGVTSCEIKSGYGLSVSEELKMLRIIQQSHPLQPVAVIPTCLAAHVPPPENSSPENYLKDLVHNLLPVLKQESLTNRIDIFLDRGAFTIEQGIVYLRRAKEMGFDLCVHANQFSRGGVEAACTLSALSADHLEVLSTEECLMLRNHRVAGIVLPGASMGLGLPYAPVRKMLDHGVSVAIASDWNPGSAPMGKLLLQAAVLGAFEKLSAAETFAGLTFRAACALKLHDRGILKPGMRADFSLFPCQDYRQILYYQGSMLPKEVFIRGNCELNK